MLTIIEGGVHHEVSLVLCMYSVPHQPSGETGSSRNFYAGSFEFIVYCTYCFMILSELVVTINISSFRSLVCIIIYSDSR